MFMVTEHNGCAEMNENEWMKWQLSEPWIQHQSWTFKTENTSTQYIIRLYIFLFIYSAFKMVDIKLLQNHYNKYTRPTLHANITKTRQTNKQTSKVQKRLCNKHVQQPWYISNYTNITNHVNSSVLVTCQKGDSIIQRYDKRFILPTVICFGSSMT